MFYSIVKYEVYRQKVYVVFSTLETTYFVKLIHVS